MADKEVLVNPYVSPKVTESVLARYYGKEAAASFVRGEGLVATTTSGGRTIGIGAVKTTGGTVYVPPSAEKVTVVREGTQAGQEPIKQTPKPAIRVPAKMIEMPASMRGTRTDIYPEPGKREPPPTYLKMPVETPLTAAAKKIAEEEYARETPIEQRRTSWFTERYGPVAGTAIKATTAYTTYMTKAFTAQLPDIPKGFDISKAQYKVGSYMTEAQQAGIAEYLPETVGGAIGYAAGTLLLEKGINKAVGVVSSRIPEKYLIKARAAYSESGSKKLQLGTGEIYKDLKEQPLKFKFVGVEQQMPKTVLVSGKGAVRFDTIGKIQTSLERSPVSYISRKAAEDVAVSAARKTLTVSKKIKEMEAKTLYSVYSRAGAKQIAGFYVTEPIKKAAGAVASSPTATLQKPSETLIKEIMKSALKDVTKPPVIPVAFVFPTATAPQKTVPSVSSAIAKQQRQEAKSMDAAIGAVSQRPEQGIKSVSFIPKAAQRAREKRAADVMSGALATTKPVPTATAFSSLVVESSAQAQSQAQSSAQAAKQAQAQAQKQQRAFRTNMRIAQITGTAGTGVLLPSRPASKAMLASKGQLGFNVYARVFGKPKLVGANLPKQAALATGIKYLDITPSASFKLEPTGQQARAVKAMEAAAYKIRPAKSKKLKGWLVEKPRFRMDIAVEQALVSKGRGKKKKRVSVI